VFIDEDFCAGCGACIPACGFANIRLRQGVAQLKVAGSEDNEAVASVSV
jgi:Fe-S-cluster-containing hydrogenase component 2